VCVAPLSKLRLPPFFLRKSAVFFVFQVDDGGAVDLGEIAAQYLGLEISPYPTGPGVKLDLPSSDSDGEIDGGQELKLP